MIVELQTVDSTNDHAKALARKGAAHGTVVWAHAQTAGRGRQGNDWVSIPGNLFMTMIVPRDITGLPFLVAVALANVIPADVRLKWPNDAILNGKKIAGILIETESGANWAVVGIGVNITHAPEGAVSLSEAGINTTARALMEKISAEISRLQGEDFSTIRAAWLKRAWKLGEEITARLPQEKIAGVFEGLDETGALLLRVGGALRTINSGEVFI